MELDIDRLHQGILNNDMRKRSGKTIRWCVEVMGIIDLEGENIFIEVPNRNIAKHYMRECLLPLLVSGGYSIHDTNFYSLSFTCNGSHIFFVTPSSNTIFGTSNKYIVRSDYW